MPFVKLDCGILNSTLWLERECREVFITALLMAEPMELTEPKPQIAITSLDETGWTVPPGWYGFVPAASVGILHRAGVEKESGLLALHRLGEPEHGSRSIDFDGRRLVRVNGGYVILNYIKYRERDYTAAERSQRYRNRLLASRRSVTPVTDADTPKRDVTRDITQAEEEEEVRSNKKKISNSKNKLDRKADADTTAGNGGINARSKRPIFQGQRFVVFDWMVEDIRRILGLHFDAFDLFEWLVSVDAKAAEQNVVKAKDDWWPWLQQALMNECRHRGLPIESTNAILKPSAAETRRIQANIAGGATSCPHRPSCVSRGACTQKILVQGRAERAT